MDKWQHMQRFVRVAELGSFTRAADSLGLPKASVSAAVSALEKSLSTRLFHRSTRKITLTPDGADYLQQCRRLLDDLDALESRFQRTPEQISGTIRVDMPTRFASSTLLPKLGEFLQQYPGIKVELGTADHKSDLIAEGIDCVLRVGTLKDSSLVARHLATVPVVNCASADYLQKHGTPHTPDDLDKHLLVRYAQPLGSRPEGFDFVQDGRVHTRAMAGVITVNGTEAYFAACLAGLGIAQYPRHSVKTFIESGRLVTLLPEYQAEAMPINLVYPSRRYPARRVQLFMDWLEQVVKSEVAD